ncbi:hypothetical protein KAR91_65430 [Candidatus Pacearchaeota archaeon]|nr:hypothetical protein [Candidatus Pacearchaeota archaeon]
MDKCSKKDCVDFDVSKEDMDLTGNCNICSNNRHNPTWVSSDDQHLPLEGNTVNPTDDVPPQTGAFPILPQVEENFAAVPTPEGTFDLKDDSPVNFTPIPVMKDQRKPSEVFLQEIAKIVPDEIVEAAKPGPLSAGWSPNGAQLQHIEKSCPEGIPPEYIVEPIIKRMTELNTGIKDSGERTEFGTGAVRDAQGGKGRFDLIPNLAVWALAHHTEKGAVKYDDRNWEMGIPIKNFIDSAKRHLTEFELGLTDENHLAAALWNVACCYETLLRIDMGILPESLDADLAYPLRGVIEDSEMVMAWDRLRYPKKKVDTCATTLPAASFPWGEDGNPSKKEVIDNV